MWDLPGSGLEPVSPALAGGFLATASPIFRHHQLARTMAAPGPPSLSSPWGKGVAHFLAVTSEDSVDGPPAPAQLLSPGLDRAVLALLLGWTDGTGTLPPVRTPLPCVSLDGLELCRPCVPADWTSHILWCWPCQGPFAGRQSQLPGTCRPLTGQRPVSALLSVRLQDRCLGR